MIPEAFSSGVISTQFSTTFEIQNRPGDMEMTEYKDSEASSRIKIIVVHVGANAPNQTSQGLLSAERSGVATYHDMSSTGRVDDESIRIDLCMSPYQRLVMVAVQRVSASELQPKM